MCAVSRFRPSLDTGTTIKLIGKLFSSGGENKYVKVFEETFAEYIGVNHAVMVPSARMGLFLVLKHLGFDKGKEVILPSYTYHSIPSVIIGAGFKPVFIDICSDDYLMDPGKLAESINENTAVVIPTHLYGLTCKMDNIMQLIGDKDIVVVEDCAQCCGAMYKDKIAGSMGTLAYFTFGLTKNITCLSGGVVTTNNENMANIIRKEIEKHGFVSRGQTAKLLVLALIMNIITDPFLYTVSLNLLVKLAGFFNKDILHDMFDEQVHVYTYEELETMKLERPNYIHALTGKLQLQVIDEINNERRRVAGRYMANLEDLEGIELPGKYEDRHHVFLNFVVKLRDRDMVACKLLSHGIDTAKGYMRACSAVEKYGQGKGTCPVAEDTEKTTLHLPIYPGMSDSTIDYVSEMVRKAVRS